ncbi:uncharacterized protein LOC122011129 [Zingiber officinale]|uniref:uncharacterized protein LOC122011129 n=1 Tax=Zingiber officinale TaxID=94328 RepID=UPI001C4B5AD1|nr:uncharacterized protein LOC122011129 [Zingiber officinale]
MATYPQEITLKVFVNKTKNCVDFVESDLDFVDVLLSFLTLRASLKCECGGDINTSVSYDLNRDDVNYEEFRGVFIKGAKFVVTDALCISLVEDLISTLNKCVNGDRNHMEVRLVKIKREQVLRILKRSLISDTPLTDVLLQNGEGITPKFSDSLAGKKVEKKVIDKEKKVCKLNMVLTRNKVLYAVASQDFVDLIFSFLTFPLGSLKKHLGSRFRMGCLNNLYGSAERLRSSGYMTAGCAERLLNPKLAPYFNCKNQVIGVEEEKEDLYYTCNGFCKLTALYFSCKSHGYSPYHESNQVTLVDPKSQLGGTISSHGSYCQKLMYMVTDELVVTPLSLESVVSFHNEIADPIKTAELSVTEAEILDVLAVALTSNTALTDAFLGTTVGVFTSVDVKGE